MPPPPARLVRLAAAALLVASLMVLLAPRPAGAAAARGDRWRWPVHGTVVGRFAYARSHAFAAGARRGIDISAASGVVVRSACSGRVTFAGTLPGGRGLGVTVRCGVLAATHLGLGRLGVRHGARVAAGTRLGVLGPAGRLRLGARRTFDRFGYVDPLALIRGDGPPGPPPAAAPRLPLPSRPAPRGVPLARAPLVPAPAAHAAPLGRAPGVVHAPPPRPARPFGRAPDTAASPARLGRRPRPVFGEHPGARIPAGAWGGLVLLAAGVPLGGLVGRGRRRARLDSAEAQAATAGGR